ncbi:MAG: hypothetical protein ACKO23_04505, partial [Gemmataceae bacterium]
MMETLFRDTPALIIPVVALLGLTIVFTTWIYLHYMTSSRIRELELAVKQDMIQRGFSPDQVEQVMQAGSMAEVVRA